jgi:hypothetical protein
MAIMKEDKAYTFTTTTLNSTQYKIFTNIKKNNVTKESGTILCANQIYRY